MVLDATVPPEDRERHARMRSAVRSPERLAVLLGALEPAP
jgi:hypothetical protein